MSTSRFMMRTDAAGLLLAIRWLANHLGTPDALGADSDDDKLWQFTSVHPIRALRRYLHTVIEFKCDGAIRKYPLATQVHPDIDVMFTMLWEAVAWTPLAFFSTKDGWQISSGHLPRSEPTVPTPQSVNIVVLGIYLG
jgi:hypothetical protein